jgi:septum formation protein
MSFPVVLLASTSPYRRDLLRRLLPDFECVAPGVEESALRHAGDVPAELAARLASAKAAAVAALRPDAIVIGSDQVATVDGSVLGKPGSTRRAIEQLQSLSGRVHQLHTAVSVQVRGTRRDFLNTTDLRMRSLTSDEIDRYVARDQPLDCAGSYRIESLGIALFDEIRTDDFTAIIGLPLRELAAVLRELGVAVP